LRHAVPPCALDRLDNGRRKIVVALTSSALTQAVAVELVGTPRPQDHDDLAVVVVQNARIRARPTRSLQSRDTDWRTEWRTPRGAAPEAAQSSRSRSIGREPSKPGEAA
jgi:hypothetical protein